MPPKKKAKTSEGSQPSTIPTHVFVLVLSSHNHASDGTEEPEVVGVFARKKDAVAHIPTLETQCDDNFPGEDYDEDELQADSTFINEDNRSDPPDNGILLELEFGGEGDKDEARIEKVPWIGKRLMHMQILFAVISWRPETAQRTAFDNVLFGMISIREEKAFLAKAS